MNPGTDSHIPNVMVTFNILGSAKAPVMAPRLGRFAIAGRKPISTPHYIPATSRGVVPHIAHDVMREHTSIGSLYIGLEDFLEKMPKEPPMYKTPILPHESILRKFISMPDDLLLVMGPRRVPAIACPTANTPTSISILTSVGFRQLEAGQYVDAIRRLGVDIVVGMADLVLGQKSGLKRRAKMVDRTHAFTRDATERLFGRTTVEGDTSATATEKCQTAYFAPLLPLENTEQMLYLADLESEMRPHVSGLALYDAATLAIIPETLGDLPRLVLGEITSPHDLLRAVSLGADLFTIPFITASSDAGLALDFAFPSPVSVSEPRPLAYDLWSSSHSTDTSPLVDGCVCYTCRNHHRAYLRHLLSAKEMLAWTLLQIHNHHTLDVFFAAIRDSIQRGTFDEDVRNFYFAYEERLPDKTGEGPRLRGYQLPAAGPHQPRRAPKVYGRLDDAAERYAESSQSSIATPDTGADGLEAHGFAKKEV